ncbi:6250_t:CDS:2 [Entrophospora sp. SA101]|nr:6250_t:CDS:2 [Entrophospora sp. SA101]CAJ0909259.1 21760_t:CDS:2 [Entrophospora sp. SA101]
MQKIIVKLLITRSCNRFQKNFYNMESNFNDKIIIKNLVVRIIIGVDSWERVKRQPVTINAVIRINVSQAGETDHLSHTVNYGSVCKTITQHAEESTYKSLEALADGLAKICIKEYKVPQITIRVEKPRALLHATSAGVEITRTKEDYGPIEKDPDALPASINNHHDIIFVKDLKVSTIIGVNPWEREEKQIVILNLTTYPSFPVSALQKDHVTKPHNYRTIVRTIIKHVEQSKYKTVEAFATAVARIAIIECHVNKITIHVEKPSALMFAESAGIEITRSKHDFENEIRVITHPYLNPLDDKDHQATSLVVKQDSNISDELKHFAFIALGSNMGDTIVNINEALIQIEKNHGCKILDTSFLYETSPMYITDQPKFLNAACRVATSLDPEALLKKLQEVEYNMGRFEKSYVKYEFVLRPLCDIGKKVEHPKLYKTCGQLLSQLLNSQSYNSDNVINKILPIRKSTWTWNTKTFIMGIINVTPDSFSDGGLFTSVDDAVNHAEKLVAEGADIIDIGGVSTRPNADDVSVEEEISRVIPVIKAIRSKKGMDNDIIISIDTFRAEVAKKAIEAGADFINDISGGKLDPNMYQVMAEANVPVCLQHMRGDPKTMQKLTQYDNVISDISNELYERVQHAMESGVKRWNIIIDPGFGFAKNYEQNFEILRKLKEFNGENGPFEGFPCLVGPSRKNFIGLATNQPIANKRGYGTAAACAASISGGANVLRVHDVKEMADVALDFQNNNEKNVIKITLNRPKRGNSLNLPMVLELIEIFEWLENQSLIRVVILTGSGGFFCTGMALETALTNSLKYYNDDIRVEYLELLEKEFNDGQKLYKTIKNCKKPIISLINGPALGGGIGLVFVTDIRIAIKDTFFKFSEVKYGLMPSIISQFIVPELGPFKSKQYFITGETIRVDQALKDNFISDVAVDSKELDEKCNYYIEKLIESAPKSIGKIKDLVKFITSKNNLKGEAGEVKEELIIKDYFVNMMISDEAKVGLTAYKNKEKPNWNNHILSKL